MSGLISTIFARESKPSEDGRHVATHFRKQRFRCAPDRITVVYNEHFEALNIHLITNLKPLNDLSTVAVTQIVEF